jgi:predicted nucleotidyltransferase
MSRTCTICTHPQRHAIEKALVAGGAYRDIAGQYGLTKSAVERHKAEHLPVALVAAAGAEETRQALDVLQQLKTINAAALTVLRDARAGQDGDLALKAIDRIQRQIELQAKLLGDLDERPVVNVLISPEWHALRGCIVVALAAFPEARVALAGVLDVG